MKLNALVGWLNSYLQVEQIKDYPGASNGLQLENRGEVTRILAAVDACEAVLQGAATQGCDLILVHHGLLWQGGGPWVGPVYRKLKLAMDHDIAVYSAHLPLDMHPEVGNNAVMARLLGMPPSEPFLQMKGQAIGLQAEWQIPIAELLSRIEKATGHPPHWAPGGPGITKRVGLVTGGAGNEIAEAAAAGIDTFITGEGSHWTYPLAEELGIHLIYAGHYATETFGVCALAETIKEKFSLPWSFFDHPTGL